MSGFAPAKNAVPGAADALPAQPEAPVVDVPDDGLTAGQRRMLTPAVKETTQRSKEIAREIRRAEVATLLRKGWTQARIAKHLNVQETVVGRDVRVLLDRWHEESNLSIQQWVTLETSRLDVATEGIWVAVELGHLQAIQTLLKIMERRAKMLGLDKPAVQQVQGPDGEALAPGLVLLIPDNGRGDGSAREALLEELHADDEATAGTANGVSGQSG
jgi:hypothetical protein